MAKIVGATQTAIIPGGRLGAAVFSFMIGKERSSLKKSQSRSGAVGR